MKKKLLIAMLCLSTCVVFAACGNKEKEASSEQPVTAEIIPIDEPVASESTEEAEEPTDTPPEGMVWSELTGLAIDEAIANQKPIAAMVDNESKALPHFGLNTADIIYEMVNSTANDRVTRLTIFTLPR